MMRLPGWFDQTRKRYGQTGLPLCRGRDRKTSSATQPLPYCQAPQDPREDIEHGYREENAA